MSKRSTRWWLMTFVVLGFALRVGAIFALRSWEHPGAMEHGFLARNILAGQGFRFNEFGHDGPSSVQSPTYPLILATCFWLFGVATPAAYVAAMVFNSALGSLTIWLAYVLARTLGGSQRVGLLAAAACGIWPTQVYLPTHTQAIAWNTAGMTAAISLFYLSVRTGSPLKWLGFSVVIALTALTEPVLLPVLALTFLIIPFWRGLQCRAGLRNAAILAGVVAVVIGPWTIRNYFVHKQFMPIKGSFWVNVWKGNKDNSSGTDRPPISADHRAKLKELPPAQADALARDAEFDAPRQYDSLSKEQMALLWGKDDAGREKVFKQWVVDWVRNNPGGYLRLCGLRLLKTLWVEWDNPKAWNLPYLVSRTALLLLSVVGLVLAVRQRWSLIYPALLMGCCLGVYTLTITAARFSLPFEPFQLGLAALAVEHLIRRIFGTTEPPVGENVTVGVGERF